MSTDGRIHIRPGVDFWEMTHEEQLAWAQAIVDATRAAYEAEGESDLPPAAPGQ